MKFMKLGYRPDSFYTTQAIRCISSEVSSDLIIQVNASRYLLHKFPLFSKSLRLQRIFSDLPTSAAPDQPIHLPEFPGGEESFELCAKFCYGITITLSAYNVVAVRCAAEYLQMTEDVEKGNLIHKIEVFFSSCILRGWRDSIVVLKSTTAFPSLAEDIRITGRCIEAIAAKVLMNPSKVSLSHSRLANIPDDVSSNGVEIQSHKTHMAASNGWWAEDIAELSIDLYWRTMIAIKSGGKLPPSLIGDALRIYVSCWLPKVRTARRTDESICSESDSDGKVETTSKDRVLLESIIGLLPVERGAVSCNFLSKLLKAANMLGASPSLKKELARRFGVQLEDATLKDLLIPPPLVSHASETRYDVDIVMSIVEMFMLHCQSPPTSPPRLRTEFVERRRSHSAENVDLEFQESRRVSSVSHSSKLKVAKIVDRYLQEIACNANFPMSKFISLAEMVPDFARTDHDDLYQAIDVYLKAHPDLTKCERKKLCRILDCRKLSMASCMHAAQNEKLPLRVVVQVLFFEHARVTKSSNETSHLPDDIRALLSSQGIDQSKPREPLSTMETSVPAEDQFCVLAKRKPTLKMKLAEDEERDVQHRDTEKLQSRKGLMKSRGFCPINGRPGRMLGKFWSNNRRAGNVKATAKS